MFRFRPTLFRGFPGTWLDIRIPCTASHSPLIEPDLQISRIRLSRDIHLRHALLDDLQQLCQSVKLLSQMNKGHRKYRMPIVELSVQVDYPSFRHQHNPANAPSFHGNYPASTLLWASPTPDQDRTEGYAFPSGVVGHSTSCRVSQVPRLICRHALSPTTPESPAAAYACCFTADDRLQPSRRISHSQWSNEVESGSLALRLAPSPFEASHQRDYSRLRSIGYMSNKQSTWWIPFNPQDLSGLSWRTGNDRFGVVTIIRGHFLLRCRGLKIKRAVYIAAI